MEKKAIFTKRRRDLLAKTVMDISKIAIAAAFANEYFFKYSPWIRFILAIVILTLFFIGIFVCPKEE